MKERLLFCALLVSIFVFAGGKAFAAEEYVSLEYRFDADFLDGIGFGGDLLDPDIFLKEADTGGFSRSSVIFTGRKKITSRFSLLLTYVMNNTSLDPDNNVFSGLLSGTDNVLHNIFEYNINDSSKFSFLFIIRNRTFDSSGAYAGFDEGVSGVKYSLMILEDFPVELSVYFRKKMYDTAGPYQGESYCLNFSKNIIGKLKVDGMAGISGRSSISKSSARVKLQYDF